MEPMDQDRKNDKNDKLDRLCLHMTEWMAHFEAFAESSREGIKTPLRPTPAGNLLFDDQTLIFSCVETKGAPTTVYSNIVQVRITQAELVLEFGTFFPESVPPPAVGPQDFVAETRVVMNISALEQLTNALVAASKARQ